FVCFWVFSHHSIYPRQTSLSASWQWRSSADELVQRPHAKLHVPDARLGQELTELFDQLALAKHKLLHRRRIGRSHFEHTSPQTHRARPLGESRPGRLTPGLVERSLGLPPAIA